MTPYSFGGLDPYFASNVFLCHFNGTNGQTSATDVSPSPKTLTFLGNAQLSTTQILYGATSLYLDGTGDYVTSPYSADFAFGAGEFAIEASVYLTAAPSTDSAICSLWKAGALSWLFGIDTSRRLTIYHSTDGTSGNFGNFTSGFTVPLNQWSSVAVTRTLALPNSTTRLYIDSVMRFTGTGGNPTFFDPSASATKFVIGGIDNSASAPACYVDEIRITKGLSREPYTPATAPFPDS